MSASNKPGCQSICYINGAKLLDAMLDANLNEKQLARKANVSEQTIRNYQASSKENPRSVRSEVFFRVCDALKLRIEECQLHIENPLTPHEEYGVLADRRFLADAQNVRSIAGNWHAQSIDLEVPGVITYKEPIPWNAELSVKQFGNRFEAIGKDKDEDGVYACGTLLENGNWIRFDYWIDNLLLRQYGTALVEYHGCGQVIQGLFLGRDSGHSSNGMVLAQLTLTRIS